MSALQVPPTLGRWALSLVAAEPSGLSAPGLSPEARTAICPPGPVADALVGALAARGIAARAVDADPDADVLVLLHGLSDTPPDEALRSAFVAARRSAPRLSAGGLLMTVQDTGGDFGLSGSARAEYGGLGALAKTAAQEWSAACKAVDLERAGRPPEVLAAALADEMLRGGIEPEVGLTAAGVRQIPVSIRTPVAPTAPVIDRDSVIVATGGARGVTAACLIALAASRGGRYALIGRTPLADEPAAVAGIRDDAGLKRALIGMYQASGKLPSPAEIGQQVSKINSNREIRETLDAITRAGGQAMYVSVDVNDPSALDAALDAVRKSWGPLSAIVHGAGVLADKLIAEKSDDAFARVYQTKVVGLRALLGATARDPLRAILLFSSVAGRCGNRGQVDYAMANEVLAKVAAREAKARPGVIVRALQWGPWEGGMVTKELKARFDALGVPLIPLPVGASFFVGELADRGAATEVVLGGEPKMGPLAEASSSRSVRMRARLDKQGFPYLADHRVAGVVVAPVVLALEWFARAATAARPDLTLAALRDVRVLRPMKLDRFDADGDWFDVTAQEISNGSGATLQLQLLRPGGTVHYSATAEMTERQPSAPTPPAHRSRPPWTGAIYDGRVLFHGHAFQVIRTLDGIDDTGIEATLTPTRDAGWGSEPWRTDPAALDGGLQLALLWSQRVLGGASLPMGLSSMKTFRDGPSTGPVRAILTGERKGSSKTLSDVVFVDSSGRVTHELRGIEAILRPD